MSDIWHEMGGDLLLSGTGDLAVAEAAEWGRQRVLRRLLTNPGDYLWAPSYGAGLPAMVGQPANEARMAAVTRAQMLQEGAVARSPMPAVNVTVRADGTVIEHVRYADAATGEPQLLTVPVQ
jgi:phage baseplate assembly protein W